MALIRITSYGVGHGDDPTAADPVVVDTTELRNPPDDPAVRAVLTQRTGLDADVAAYVMATPGARELVTRYRRRIEDLADKHDQVHVFVHCYGGRHRSVAIAEQLGTELSVFDHYVYVHHRHIERPVLPSRPRT
ncbi:RapZ C-terminal domain-containing protein [Streptomyces zaomyceticus]|uniref:RapZ C-terminal domain-containing protein n=1 Tax=Streptomyces zaomyceticus TaxID=68286 RepID=UPI0037AED5D2